MADLHAINGVIFLVDSDGEVDKKAQSSFMYVDTEGKLNFSDTVVAIKDVNGNTLKEVAST